MATPATARLPHTNNVHDAPSLKDWLQVSLCSEKQSGVAIHKESLKNDLCCHFCVKHRFKMLIYYV